jgi:hypothetical protein
VAARARRVRADRTPAATSATALRAITARKTVVGNRKARAAPDAACLIAARWRVAERARRITDRTDDNIRDPP